MIIHVRQIHIDEGIPHDCEWCAIGLALREQLQLTPVLDRATLECMFDNLLPENALVCMVDFDKGKTMQPIDFELDNTALDLTGYVITTGSNDD